VIAFALPASAQVKNGEFTGLVTDPSVDVVSQARVVIHNLGTDYKLEVRTNDDGICLARPGARSTRASCSSD
jgi:hypothetical protein